MGCKDGGVRCVGCENGGLRVGWGVGDEGCVRMVERVYVGGEEQASGSGRVGSELNSLRLHSGTPIGHLDGHVQLFSGVL